MTIEWPEGPHTMFNHPQFGRLEFEYAPFEITEQPHFVDWGVG